MKLYFSHLIDFLLNDEETKLVQFSTTGFLLQGQVENESRFIITWSPGRGGAKWPIAFLAYMQPHI